MEIILYTLGGLIFGGVVSSLFFKKKENSDIISQTERIKKLNSEIGSLNNNIFEKKKESNNIIMNAKNEANNIKNEVGKKEMKLDAKMEVLEEKEKDLDRKFQTLEDRKNDLELVKKDFSEKTKIYEEKISKIDDEKIESLGKISKLSPKDAEIQLLEEIEKKSKDILITQLNKCEDEVKEEFDNKAKKAIALAIQRFAGEVASENTVTIVEIGDDELKGKIIGKEGRNINSLERETGVDIIIDDTPGSIMISGFDLFRRYIAKKAIEELLQDGRVHPARIEEVVKKIREEANGTLKQLGETAVNKMGFSGIHPDLLRILGRLRFRTSYGQNILKHSMEVGNICGLLAAEIGVDQEKAKMAGFFHDIGKAVDHEVEGGHAPIGYDILKKYNIAEDVAHAVGAHHEEMPIESPLDFIVCAADMISGSRPGARRENIEVYFKRLKALEDIATSFDGVTKAYAIQAGKEVRIMVNPNELSDLEARKVALNIVAKIEKNMQYPGQIKVNLIRETNIIDFAK